MEKRDLPANNLCEFETRIPTRKEAIMSNDHTSEIIEADARSIIAPEAADSGVRGPIGRMNRAWQRGMATAEYAVGILAAVALALVLLNIFTNNDFFTAMLKFVVGLLGKVAGMIP